MSASADQSDMLDEGKLREVDKRLLDYLQEGRVTPAYGRDRLEDDGVKPEKGNSDVYSRGYVQQRLARFEEHGHVRNLYETGLYELVSDPRESESETPHESRSG